jgi:four helix bundle protein
MAKYERFEDLPAWQAACRLYHRVLDLLEIQGVPLTPGFRNQLDRAALSVSNNIAEGFERVTTPELISFLAIARGSAGEVRSIMSVVLVRPKLKPHL